MAEMDGYIMMGIGGFFLLLCVIAFLWARSEERGIDETILHSTDVKNLEKPPIGPNSLRIGGTIFAVLGAILIILGGVFLSID